MSGSEGQLTGEGAAAFPWTPVVYAAFAAAAAILHVVFPLPWLGPPASDILFATGLLACAGAVAIGVAAVRALGRAGTTLLPRRPGVHLVTSGPYSFTRNPVCLGSAMLMVGAGAAFGVLWLMLAAPLAAFAAQKLGIEREERLLAQRFGKRYRDYQKKVRRWI